MPMDGIGVRGGDVRRRKVSAKSSRRRFVRGRQQRRRVRQRRRLRSASCWSLLSRRCVVTRFGSEYTKRWNCSRWTREENKKKQLFFKKVTEVSSFEKYWTDREGWGRWLPFAWSRAANSFKIGISGTECQPVSRN